MPGEGVLATLSVCVWIAGTVMLTGGDVVGPDFVLAVFVTPPASMSAWVVTYVPVQVIEAPGASPAPIEGHATEAILLSVTVTAVVSVTLPELVTR